LNETKFSASNVGGKTIGISFVVLIVTQATFEPALFKNRKRNNANLLAKKKWKKNVFVPPCSNVGHSILQDSFPEWLNDFLLVHHFQQAKGISFIPQMRKKREEKKRREKPPPMNTASAFATASAAGTADL
jgi:hypothetical protein